jgi:predicted nuclease of predicted toxin-antitoxin system
MRILADENFPLPVVESLREQGHDVIWARRDCPGTKDRALIERAEAEGRLLLTLDKDFWELTLRRPVALKRCGVILFRVHPAIPRNLSPLVDNALRAQRPWVGHISIVTRDSIEMFDAGGPGR